MRGPALGIAAGVILVLALLGSCVQDYATATPQVGVVLILDKQFEPGHYHEDCDRDSDGRRRCSTRWVPPSWTVEYSDEFRHWTSVSQGTWDSLRLGEPKVLHYDLGGGIWEARYNETFLFGPPVAEGSWPTK